MKKKYWKRKYQNANALSVRVIGQRDDAREENARLRAALERIAKDRDYIIMDPDNITLCQKLKQIASDALEGKS